MTPTNPQQEAQTLEARHTPTPWELPTGPYIVQHTGEGENFSNGDWNIFPPLGESGPVAIVNSEANAAIIVRAVNSFDDMLSALKELVRVVGGTLQGYGILEAPMKAAELAISKAEKQP